MPKNLLIIAIDRNYCCPENMRHLRYENQIQTINQQSARRQTLELKPIMTFFSDFMYEFKFWLLIIIGEKKTIH